MNWKQFKDAVESQGVTDNMKIKRICLSTDEMNFGELDVLFNIPDGVVII